MLLGQFHNDVLVNRYVLNMCTTSSSIGGSFMRRRTYDRGSVACKRDLARANYFRDALTSV